MELEPAEHLTEEELASEQPCEVTTYLRRMERGFQFLNMQNTLMKTQEIVEDISKHKRRSDSFDENKKIKRRRLVEDETIEDNRNEKIEKKIEESQIKHGDHTEHEQAKNSSFQVQRPTSQEDTTSHNDSPSSNKDISLKSKKASKITHSSSHAAPPISDTPNSLQSGEPLLQNAPGRDENTATVSYAEQSSSSLSFQQEQSFAYAQQQYQNAANEMYSQYQYQNAANEMYSQYQYQNVSNEMILAAIMPTYQRLFSVCNWINYPNSAIPYIPSNAQYPAHENKGRFRRNDDLCPRIGKGWYKGKLVCYFYILNGRCDYNPCRKYHPTPEEIEVGRSYQARMLRRINLNEAVQEILYEKECREAQASDEQGNIAYSDLYPDI